MARRKGKPRKRPQKASPSRRSARKRPNVVLENTSIEDLRARKKETQVRLEFAWLYYWDLERQRTAVREVLLSSLGFGVVENFEIVGWQRAVPYAYSLTPLSVVGSLRSLPGGRFNIGALDPSKFPPFPALYLAEDRETAIQELLCQENDSELSNFDFALQKPNSLSSVAISGILERCFDLRNATNLRRFVNIIKTFKVSDAVRLLAAKLTPSPKLSLVSLPSELRDSLLEPRWRFEPMQNDVPANSQIFGQLVQAAGIQGIVYPSKMTGRMALAVFTRTFGGTSSFLRLDDRAPVEVISQLGAGNYGLAELTADQLRIGVSGDNY